MCMHCDSFWVHVAAAAGGEQIVPRRLLDNPPQAEGPTYSVTHCD